MPINLNNNPSIEVDTSGYGGFQGTETISRITSEYYHGIASLKTITNNIRIEEGWYRNVSAEASAGTQYTFSVYLKGSGTVILSFYDNVSEMQISTVITLTSTWTRYSLTKTFGAGSTFRTLSVLTDVQQVITFYTDAIMHTEGSTLWAFFTGTADWTYTGAISFVGTLQRRVSRKRLLEGTLNFIGTLQRKLNLHRLLEGNISFIGTLLSSGLFKRTLEGSISFIGTLSRKLTFKRTLEGKISFIGKLKIRKLWKAIIKRSNIWTPQGKRDNDWTEE